MTNETPIIRCSTKSTATIVRGKVLEFIMENDPYQLELSYTPCACGSGGGGCSGGYDRATLK